MKLKKIIISLLVTLILSLNMSAVVLSQEATTMTEPEKACTEQKPDYEELMKNWKGVKQKDERAYKEAFEAAQLKHHAYVGCMFDFAEMLLLKSEGAEQGGIIDSNLLNTGSLPFVGGLIDWMIPDQACLTPEALKEIIGKGDPSQMLAPILQAHTDYKIHLQTIGTDFDANGVALNESGQVMNQLNALNKKSEEIATLKRQRKMEIESSLIAIDLMFTSLKELRLSLVMHVHFQCALKFLEQYRKALENLRNLIEPLPKQLEDASISK